MSATFQPDGIFMASKTAIKESELSSAVLNYKNVNHKDVIFDNNGKFLNEV
jgi:hypothetical protein